MNLDWIAYIIIALAAVYVCRFIYRTWTSIRSGCGCSKKACPMTRIKNLDKTEIDSHTAKK